SHSRWDTLARRVVKRAVPRAISVRQKSTTLRNQTETNLTRLTGNGLAGQRKSSPEVSPSVLGGHLSTGSGRRSSLVPTGARTLTTEAGACGRSADYYEPQGLVSPTRPLPRRLPRPLRGRRI